MIALLVIVALFLAFALGWIARIHYEGRPRAFELVITPDKMQPAKSLRDRRPW